MGDRTPTLFSFDDLPAAPRSGVTPIVTPIAPPVTETAPEDEADGLFTDIAQGGAKWLGQGLFNVGKAAYEYTPLGYAADALTEGGAPRVRKYLGIEEEDADPFAPEAPAKPPEYGELEDLLQYESPTESRTGTVLDVGSAFLPNPVSKARIISTLARRAPGLARAAIASPKIANRAINLAREASMGAALGAFQEGDPITGAAIGGALSQVPGLAPKAITGDSWEVARAAKITKGAKQRAGQALAPTTKPNKRFVERNWERIVRESPWVTDLEGYQQRAMAAVEVAGQRIDDVLSGVRQGNQTVALQKSASALTAAANALLNPRGGVVANLAPDTRADLRLVLGGLSRLNPRSTNLKAVQNARDIVTRAMREVAGENRKVGGLMMAHSVRAAFDAGTLAGDVTRSRAGMRAGKRVLGEVADDIAPSRVNTRPIIRQLQRAKQRHFQIKTDRGAWADHNVPGVAVMDNLIAQIQQHGDEISVDTLRGIRQQWDEIVAGPDGKGFLTTLADASTRGGHKLGGGILRGRLGRKVPALLGPNAEFSYQSNLRDVLGDTVTRRTGQTKGPMAGVMAAVGAGTGGTVGSMVGGLLGAPALAVPAGLLFYTVTRVIKSPQFNMLSAKTRLLLADALRRGETNVLRYALGRAQGEYMRSTMGGNEPTKKNDLTPVEEETQQERIQRGQGLTPGITAPEVDPDLLEDDPDSAPLDDPGTDPTQPPDGLPDFDIGVPGIDPMLPGSPLTPDDHDLLEREGAANNASPMRQELIRAGFNGRDLREALRYLAKLVEPANRPMLDLPDLPGAAGKVQRVAEQFTSPMDVASIVTTAARPVLGTATALGRFAERVGQGVGAATALTGAEGIAEGIEENDPLKFAGGTVGLGFGAMSTRPGGAVPAVGKLGQRVMAGIKAGGKDAFVGPAIALGATAIADNPAIKELIPDDEQRGKLAQWLQLAGAASVPAVLMAKGTAARGRERREIERRRRLETPIEAWHGSPADFPEFDSQYIGTGEGNQSYSRGLYFGGAEETGRAYQEALAKDADNKVQLGDVEHDISDDAGRHGLLLHMRSRGIDPADAKRAIDMLAVYKGDVEMARAQFDWEAVPELEAPDIEAGAARDRRASEAIGLLTPSKTGTLYDVRLHVDPDELLDWDAPLSAQPKAVRDLFAEHPIKADTLGSAFRMTKHNISDKLAARLQAMQDRGEIPKDAQSGAHLLTEALKVATGAPGLKYLDQHSRIQGDAVDILRKHKGDRAAALTAAKAKHRQAQDIAERANWGGDSNFSVEHWREIVQELSKPESRNYVIYRDDLIEIARKLNLRNEVVFEAAKQAGATVRERRGVATASGEPLPPDTASDTAGKPKAPAHAITVDGRPVAMVIRAVDKRAGERLVWLDVDKVEQSWSGSTGFYVGKGGGTDAGGMRAGDGELRYDKFGKFLQTGVPVEAPNIGVSKDGGVHFGNGRHRWAVLRDKGVKAIPVAMDAESARYAQQHGMVAEAPKALTGRARREAQAAAPSQARGAAVQAVYSTMKPLAKGKAIEEALQAVPVMDKYGKRNAPLNAEGLRKKAAGLSSNAQRVLHALADTLPAGARLQRAEISALLQGKEYVQPRIVRKAHRTTGGTEGRKPRPGAPRDVYTRAHELTRLRHYLQMVKDGADGWDWYERGGKAIMFAANDDPGLARELAEALAITSSGTAVVVNSGFGTKGSQQFTAGVPVQTGQYPTRMSRDIDAVYRSGEAASGKKRGPFSDTLAYGGGFGSEHTPARPVNDIWQGEAWGYMEADGSPLRRGYTDAEHAWMDRMSDKALEVALNDPAFRALLPPDAGPWNLYRLQAAAWIGGKRHAAKVELAQAKREGRKPVGVPQMQDESSFTAIGRYPAHGLRPSQAGASSSHMPELREDTPEAAQLRDLVHRAIRDESGEYDAPGRDQILAGQRSLVGASDEVPMLLGAGTAPGIRATMLAGTEQVDNLAKDAGKKMDEGSLIHQRAAEASSALLGGRDVAEGGQVMESAPGRRKDAAQFTFRTPPTAQTLLQVDQLLAQAGATREGVMRELTPDGLVLYNRPETGIPDEVFAQVVDRIRKTHGMPGATLFGQWSGTRDTNRWDTPEGQYGQGLYAGIEPMASTFDKVMPALARNRQALDQKLREVSGGRLSLGTAQTYLLKVVANEGHAGLRRLGRQYGIPLALLMAALDSAGADTDVPEQEPALAAQ